LLLTLKFYFESHVRFEQVGPVISRLEESALNAAYKKTSLLCVGCTAGIGEALAQAACNNGGSVVVVGRREKKFEPCIGTITSIAADLSSVATARQTARQISNAFQIDTVVFTVGITAGSVRKVNSEGIELDAAVSFYSRYVMSEVLIPKLVSTPTRKARVFIMGFPGADGEGNYHDFNWESSEWGR
jgi:NAD(P)-dependent dehydrogenase (short-subunit alcohol dehydrogenase family)